MATKDKIMKILEKVNDPELGFNVVELGLIYDVSIENKKTEILMTFTTPLCPYGDTLLANVKDELKKSGVKDFNVKITFQPAWSLDKIKPEIREQFMLPIDI